MWRKTAAGYWQENLLSRKKVKIIKIKFKFKFAGQRAEVEIPGTDFGPRYSGIYVASSEQTKNGDKFKFSTTLNLTQKILLFKNRNLSGLCQGE